jgi:hypothetical protein
MAAAEAAAAAAAADAPSSFSRMPNGDSAAVDLAIVTCPSVGGPHQPLTTATAAAVAAVSAPLTGTASQLFSLGSAAPSAASGGVGSARMSGPVTLLVGMWKILTSYLQVRRFASV